MEKSQVSFEFIVLFGILFFAFAVALSFLFIWLRDMDSASIDAERISKDIKSKIITASLSESDFTSQIEIPDKIGATSIRVLIYENPENLLIVEDEEGNALARIFLPVVDNVAGTVTNGPASYLMADKNL